MDAVLSAQWLSGLSALPIYDVASVALARAEVRDHAARFVLHRQEYALEADVDDEVPIRFGEIDDLAQLLGTAKVSPRGLLRVNATLGFGRGHVAPVISRFVRKYPQVEVQMQLSVNPPPLTEDVFDGDPLQLAVVAPDDAVAQHRRMNIVSRSKQEND